MFPWGVLITGVVGIAGVAGTLLSARMASESATKDLKLSISAENERARLARKQQAYAAFHDAISRIKHMRPSASEDKASEINDAMAVLFTITAEMALLAPRHVYKLANDLGETTMAQAEAMRDGTEMPDAPEGQITKLVVAMRRDLGEPWE